MAESGTEIEVSVLGPVEIRGSALSFRRAAAKALVVYLAMHRNGARNEVWGAALWADRPVASATLHSTVSVARRALGQSRCGTPHLTRRERRLCLADTVGTDLDHFISAAESADPDRWLAAMRLVRGRPFEGLCLSDWAVIDGTQAAIESIVSDVALKGMDHALGQGQAAQAEWIVRQGLRANPYDERLYRALLQAMEAKGDRIGLHSTMTELLRKAADAGGARPGMAGRTRPAGTPALLHPRTVALYQRLAYGDLPAAGGEPARL
jgi:DNA-binding SARP family transcriptional activator